MSERSHLVNGVKLSNQVNERFVCTSAAAVRRVFVGLPDEMRNDALNLLGRWGAVVVTFIPRKGKPYRIKTEGCQRG